MRRLKTVRRPPIYPKTPGHLPCSSLTHPLPLSSRVSIGVLRWMSGLGEPHATVHRALADLLADRIVGRVSHGTAHLPSSQRYYLTTNGVRETAGVLGFETPTDFVRAYPVSREWLALLIRRMDAVAAIYRLAATLSPGIGSLQSPTTYAAPRG